MNYPVYIQLFGTLRVRQGEQVIERFRTQKTAALLAYLAYHNARTHPREELIEIFWPDADLEGGRGSLRTALASLRRQLEPPGIPTNSVLSADRTEVRLNPAIVTTDLAEFEAALTRAARETDSLQRADTLARAIALYRGPLLPGMYEDWVLQARTRLEQAYIGALRALEPLYAERGDFGRAIECVQRILAIDPLLEEAHAQLMRLYAANGQPGAALRQYEELTRLLRRELDEDVSPETRALAEQLARTRSAETVGDATKRAAPTFSPLAPAEPSPAPAPVSSDLPTPRLPLQLSRFFGREIELTRLLGLLRGENASPEAPPVRLITLTGPGGSGKTRLAIETARRLLEDFGGAVYFVPLAEITDADLIAPLLLDALGGEHVSEEAVLEQVLARLSRRSTLLVLDNFEQLAHEEGIRLLWTLLEQAPLLTCLVTSRQRLDIGGEREIFVPPLPVPEVPGAPEQLVKFAGVQLFVDRAQAVRPDFQITRENAAALATLCERLEGIPLAIELAAAWAQALTPTQMLARLDQRFDLLTSQRKDLAPRHRTLRAAIDWSYRLLSPELERLFAKLSVFRGGWTLESAEAVCEDRLALERLVQLRERSLVGAEEVGETMRFGFLETLREYAGEQLSAEERATLEARHAAYFARLAEQAEAHRHSTERLRWQSLLTLEQDNFRAALTCCRARDDAETGLRLAGALAEFWAERGNALEGIRWLRAFLTAGKEVEPRIRAKALYGFAQLGEVQRYGQDILALYEQSLKLYRKLGDKARAAAVLRRMHTHVYFLNWDLKAAIALLEESLALCRASGDVIGIAESLVQLGSRTRDQGDTLTALVYYEQGMALYRHEGDMHGLSVVLGEMGYLLTEQQEYDRAAVYLQENLAICRELDNKLTLGHACWLAGRLEQARARYDDAAALLEEGAALARQTGARQQLINCLINRGMVAEGQQEPEAALRYYEESVAIAHEMNTPPSLLLPLWCAAGTALRLRAYALAQEHYQAYLRIVQERANVRSIVQCLDMLAGVAALTERPTLAARLFGAGDGAREREKRADGLPRPADCLSGLEAAQNALGAQAFERERQVGYALTLEQAIEWALTFPE